MASRGCAEALVRMLPRSVAGRRVAGPGRPPAGGPGRPASAPSKRPLPTRRRLARSLIQSATWLQPRPPVGVGERYAGRHLRDRSPAECRIVRRPGRASRCASARSSTDRGLAAAGHTHDTSSDAPRGERAGTPQPYGTYRRTPHAAGAAAPAAAAADGDAVSVEPRPGRCRRSSSPTLSR